MNLDIVCWTTSNEWQLQYFNPIPEVLTLLLWLYVLHIDKVPDMKDVCSEFYD